MSHETLILEHLAANYRRMYHAPVRSFAHPYIVPGAGYEDCLWDWDTFFASRAIIAILDAADAPAEARAQMFSAMRGSVLNLLSFQQPNGAVPFSVYLGGEHHFAEMLRDQDEPNQAKPVLAQFAAMLLRGDPGSGHAWLGGEGLARLRRFLSHYDDAYLHAGTGLYRWRSDAVIGVDNDPCTFGRPRDSSVTPFLNCLMAREFAAMAELERAISGDEAAAATWLAKRDALAEAIRAHLWDRRDRFFYSLDIQCATDHSFRYLHKGLGVFWPGIPLRIRTWTGFLPMWAGVATPEQARELVRRHLDDAEALGCDFGIRSLAANEPMYDCRETGNPSNWLGPVWMIANYLVFRGLADYGYRVDATAFCAKVVRLLGRDIERHGAMHEYYVPETGEGVMNRGFMNWNYLIGEMILTVRAWRAEGTAGSSSPPAFP
jgi:putative isomerase